MKKIMIGLIAILLMGCNEPQKFGPIPILVKPKKALLVKPTIHWFTESKEDKAKQITINGIKHFEGFFPKAYICAGGRRTCGYGFTDKYYCKSITRSRADYLLENPIWADYAAIVDKTVKVKLTPYQRCALISFTYNTGEGNLKTLVNGPNRLNSGNYASVPIIMQYYVKAKGKTLKGLVRRRQWEAQVWNMN